MRHELGEEVEIELRASGNDRESKILVNGKMLPCTGVDIRARAGGRMEVVLETYTGLVRLRGVMEPVTAGDKARLEESLERQSRFGPANRRPDEPRTFEMP